MFKYKTDTKLVIHKFYFILIPLIFCYSLSAQQNAATSSKELITQLKEGALIVRIYMNKPKVDLLNKAILGEVDEKKKAKLQKMLDSHQADRLVYKQKVIDAFRLNYNFSKLYFIHDYDVKKLMKGEREGIFLDQDGNYDSNIKLDAVKYFMAGRADNENVFIIFDEKGSSLPSDFPSRYDRNILQGLKKVFSSFKLRDYVLQLNKKLSSYYSKI